MVVSTWEARSSSDYPQAEMMSMVEARIEFAICCG